MPTSKDRGREELNKKKSDTKRSENESDDEIMQKNRFSEARSGKVRRMDCRKGGDGSQTLAEAIGADRQRLSNILLDLRKWIIHRAIRAYDRSPETFGEETLNDIDETIHNNCTNH